MGYVVYIFVSLIEGSIFYCLVQLILAHVENPPLRLPLAGSSEFFLFLVFWPLLAPVVRPGLWSIPIIGEIFAAIDGIARSGFSRSEQRTNGGDHLRTTTQEPPGEDKLHTDDPLEVTLRKARMLRAAEAKADPLSASKNILTATQEFPGEDKPHTEQQKDEDEQHQQGQVEEEPEGEQQPRERSKIVQQRTQVHLQEQQGNEGAGRRFILSFLLALPFGFLLGGAFLAGAVTTKEPGPALWIVGTVSVVIVWMIFARDEPLRQRWAKVAALAFSVLFGLWVVAFFGPWVKRGSGLFILLQVAFTATFLTIFARNEPFTQRWMKSVALVLAAFLGFAITLEIASPFQIERGSSSWNILQIAVIVLTWVILSRGWVTVGIGMGLAVLMVVAPQILPSKQPHSLESSLAPLVQNDSTSNTATQITQATSTELTGQVQVATRGELSAEAQDAVDMTIVLLVLSARQGLTNAAPPLSEAVRQRLAKYEEVRHKLSMRGVMQSLSGKTTLSEGGEVTCSYEGILRHSVRFTAGSFNLDKGDIVVQEGARMELDGNPYVFESRRWKAVAVRTVDAQTTPKSLPDLKALEAIGPLLHTPRVQGVGDYSLSKSPTESEVLQGIGPLFHTPRVQGADDYSPQTVTPEPSARPKSQLTSTSPPKPSTQAAIEAIAAAIAYLPDGPCSPQSEFSVTIVSIKSYDPKNRNWPARASASCFRKELVPPAYIKLGERDFRLYHDPKGTLKARYIGK